MSVHSIMFSVNSYDKDGELDGKGIFLHFGETRVYVAPNIEEFRKIIPHFESMIEEIETEYPEARE